MKKLSTLTVITMLMLAVSGIVNAGPLGTFNDFTKWAGADGTTVATSTEHKTTGENCALITIPGGKKYPGIVIENRGVFNLSNAQTMTFDCFNPGKQLKFTLKVKSPGKQFSKKFIIPSGQNKIKITLDDIKIDMSAVKYLKIWVKKPADKIVLYLDNITFE